MGHGHGHLHAHGGHGHGHAAASDVERARSRRRLSITLGLVLCYMLAEVVGGLVSGSLALLADAGHMLSDAAALFLSLFALGIAGLPPTDKRTYGYHRAEILVAFVNGTFLVVVALGVFWEAVERLQSPPEVQGPLMLAVAAGGLLVNLVGLWLLHEGKERSLNLRGAWLHVLGDSLGSVGAMTAGALVWGFGWRWADPAASMAIGLLLIYSAWDLIREAGDVLMMACPSHLDVAEIRGALLEVPGVLDVHDLHCWTITSGLVDLSGHVVVGCDCHREELLRTLRDRVHERFGIEHVTLQIEPEGFEERVTAV